jgi:hypothetical protein
MLNLREYPAHPSSIQDLFTATHIDVLRRQIGEAIVMVLSYMDPSPFATGRPGCRLTGMVAVIYPASKWNFERSGP